MTETEIKLPVASVAAMRRLLRRLGWRVSVRRHLEHNLVFDRPDGSLLAAGSLLRLRSSGKLCLLTVKRPMRPSALHKVREEFEIETTDTASAAAILNALDYQVSWRYEKYRTQFTRLGVKGKIFDRPDGSLLAAGSLLRLRSSGKLCLLTVKRPMRPSALHKVREEFEIETNTDTASAAAILNALDYQVSWRYEKYRTQFTRLGVKGKILPARRNADWELPGTRRGPGVDRRDGCPSRLRDGSLHYGKLPQALRRTSPGQEESATGHGVPGRPQKVRAPVIPVERGCDPGTRAKVNVGEHADHSHTRAIRWRNGSGPLQPDVPLLRSRH